jgi:NADPH-dependent FMN reductase
MQTCKVGYLVGSLSAGSINRILSKALIKAAPADLEFVEVPLKDPPLYNYDFDDHHPPAARALKAAPACVNAVLFVSPEYNRSMPGPLRTEVFTSDGEVLDRDTKAFLTFYMEEFREFIIRVLTVVPQNAPGHLGWGEP